MESSDKATAALQQEVTQLKHKLRVRAQLVSSLQQKSTAKGGADLKQLFEQLEELTIEAGELRRQNLDLANENAILGKALNKLKDQQPSDFSSKELQDALLDVNDELDRTKKQLSELQEAKSLSDQQIRELTSHLHLLESQKAAASSSLHLAELERSKTEEKTWKQRYMREVQNTFNLQSAQATLAEENKCHIEFIAVLEGKIQQLESERAEHFNRSLCDLHRMRFETATVALERCMNKPLLQEQTAAAVLRTELACERDINQELRAELQRIVGKCDDLQSSLAVARANQLQTSMRLEAESNRVKSLEDMRIADICTITRLEEGDNKSPEHLTNRLDQTQMPPSFSRIGVTNDFINPIFKSENFSDVQSRLLRNRHLFIGRKPRTPISVRVGRALEVESTQKIETEEQPKVRYSSNFVSTSREYHQRLQRPQAPPLGQYYPKYDVMLRGSPSIMFPKADTLRNPSESRCKSEELKMTCQCSKIIHKKTLLRLPGLSFDKQTKRADFVDPRKGPHERRFMMDVNSSFESTQVHSFKSYAPRSELFPSPDYSPDYDPKYDFVYRRNK